MFTPLPSCCKNQEQFRHALADTPKNWPVTHSPAVSNSSANDSLTFTSVYLESCLCTMTKNPHQKSTKAKHSLQLHKLNSCFEWGFNYLFPGKAKHNKLGKQINKQKHPLPAVQNHTK